MAGRGFELEATRAFLQDVSFLEEMRDILEPEAWGEADLSATVEVVRDHFDAHGQVPDRPMLEEALADLGISTNGELWQPLKDDRIVKAHVRRWLRERVLRQSIIDAAEILDSDVRRSGYLHRVKEALEKGLYRQQIQRRKPMVYHEEVEERLKKLVDRSGEYVPTGVRPLDPLIGGGLYQGELGVILGLVGFGKTSTLINFGRHALELGLNVIHWTLEIDAKNTIWRYDQSLLRRKRGEIIELIDELGEEGVAEMIRNRSTGRLVVIEHPGDSAKVSDLERDMDQFQSLQGSPDLLIIDYADLLHPPRREKERRNELQAIYVQLRSIALRRKIPVWTACQAKNVKKKKDEFLTIQDAAESWGKMHVADTVISANQRAGNQLDFYVAKRRQEAIGDSCMVGVDWLRCLILDDAFDEQEAE